MLPKELNCFFENWASIGGPRSSVPAREGLPRKEFAGLISSLATAIQKTEPAKQTSLFDQVGNFFAEWQSARPVAVQKIFRKEIDQAELDRFLTSLKPGLAQLQRTRRTGVYANVWRAANLNRDELRNSAILAWLLDPRGDHGQGAEILIRLLSRIAAKGLGDGNFPRPSRVTPRGHWTSVESCPTGERESRIDIEIDGDAFLLFIEVKIDAPETNDQLDRYLVIGASNSAGRPWGVVYLTPDGRAPSAVKNNERIALTHPQLVCLSWRDVSDVLRNYANELPPCIARHLISQFSDFVLEFSRP